MVHQPKKNMFKSLGDSNMCPEAFKWLVATVFMKMIS